MAILPRQAGADAPVRARAPIQTYMQRSLFVVWRLQECGVLLVKLAIFVLHTGKQP